MKKTITPPVREEAVWDRIAATCLVMTVVSFGGFCIESIFVALTLRYVDNRNMVLPFLIGYGLAMTAIYLLFGTPTAPRLFGRRILEGTHLSLRLLYYFMAVFLFVSIGECCVGSFVEQVCDVTWWDYSSIPLHVTKFTSVPTSIGFSLPILGFMQFCYLPLYRCFGRMKRNILYPLALVLMVLLFADCIHSGIRMYLTHDFMILWKLHW